MEYDARLHIFVSTAATVTQEWPENDVRRWGLEDLQRWGKKDLQRYTRTELVHWDEQKQIEKEIDELEASWNEAWDRWYAHTSTPRKSQRSSSNDSGVGMEEDSSKPSFMRPTRSFKLRTLGDTTPELGSRSCSPVAGPPSTPRKPRFKPRENHTRDTSIMGPTKAWQLKKLPPHGVALLQQTKSAPNDQSWREQESLWGKENENDVWETYQPKVDNSNLDEVGRVKPENCTDCKARAKAQCANCAEHVAKGLVPCCSECYALEQKHAELLESTRCWAEIPSEQLRETFGPITFEIQQEFKEAYDSLTKGALWLFLRHHRPELQQRYYPESPEQISFGYGDLFDKGFGRPQEPGECLEQCGRLARTVWAALEKMIDHRNSIAHRNYSTPQQLRTMMGDAQGLAVAVGDEKIAMAIRGLRDEVDVLLKASGEEIKRKHEDVLAGKEVVWKIHEQNYFMNCWWEHDLTGIIGAAAKAWRSKNDAVGKDEAFVARVKKMRSWTYWKPLDQKTEMESCYAEYAGSRIAEAEEKLLEKDEWRPELDGELATVEGSETTEHVLTCDPVILVAKSRPLPEEIAGEKSGSTDCDEVDGRPATEKY